MDQLFVLVQRRLDGYMKIFVEHDLMEALILQKALIATDNPSPEELEIVKQMMTQKDVHIAVNNLNKTFMDRLCNDEEEVIIIYFPKRDVVR